MTKNRAIIFIHKDRFEYFDEAQSKIFQFVFQPDVIQDLEVMDKDKLNTQIKSFVETNKLPPASILFIFADVIIFEKSFPMTSNIDKDSEIQKFLENIPFEHVNYKVIDSQNYYKVLAINKELFTSLKSSFEALQFKSLCAIPQSSLGESYRTSQNLNSDLIKYTLSQFDSLQKQAFIQEEIKPAASPTGEQSPNVATKPPTALDKYRLAAVVSFFAIALGALSFVLYFQYTQKSRATPVPSTIVAPPPTTLQPTVEETPLSTTSATPSESNK